jgi:hypothetical protein
LAVHIRKECMGMYVKKPPPFPSPPGREGKLTRRERKEQENLAALKISRARPRPHWPAGLDGAWAEYAPVDCPMCGRLLTCKDRQCQTDHEHNHACMATSVWSERFQFTSEIRSVISAENFQKTITTRLRGRPEPWDEQL